MTEDQPFIAAQPSTCYYCHTLITEAREAELVKVPGEPDLVLVHPACRSKPLPAKSDSPAPYSPLPHISKF